MDINDVRLGDTIVQVDDTVLDVPFTVIETVPSGSKVRGPDTPGGCQWWIYGDQVEVGLKVERELGTDAFVIISDSLLMMAEWLESEGHPSEMTRAVLREWHRFSTPSTDTRIVLHSAEH